MSDDLFAAAVRVPEDLKRLLKIEGGSHSGSVRGIDYEAAVTQFTRDASRTYLVAQNDYEPASFIPKP